MLWLTLVAAGAGACGPDTSGYLLGANAGLGMGSGGGSGVDTLAFSVPPSSATAGSVITPAIQVTVLDSLHQPDTAFTNGITIAIGTNPSGGTLSGTATVTPVNGIASFGDLSIDRAGTGYTLKASAPNAVAAVSSSFNIN